MRAKVLKTYKLYIGGKFPRTESGRSYEINGPKGEFVANACLASRKDLRDAVTAARAAQAGWAKATAYNRGQILYRMAEMMENRAGEYVEEIQAATGMAKDKAGAEVATAIDRLVHYAGWSDKFAALVSSVNPVAAAMHNFTTAEPTGVVGIVCPNTPTLLGAVALIAPVIVSGNTCVVILSERHPTPALAWSEALAVSDLPGGVVNLLSGKYDELTPHLASHIDVDALDLSGIDPNARSNYQEMAAESVKRVTASDTESEGLAHIEPFLEYKTTWHSVGW